MRGRIPRPVQARYAAFTRARGPLKSTLARPACVAGGIPAGPSKDLPSERFAFIDSLTVMGIVSTQVRATVGMRCVLDKAPELRLIWTTYNGRDSRASPHCRRLCRVPCSASPHWHTLRARFGSGLAGVYAAPSRTLCVAADPRPPGLVFFIGTRCPEAGRPNFLT